MKVGTNFTEIRSIIWECYGELSANKSGNLDEMEELPNLFQEEI